MNERFIVVGLGYWGAGSTLEKAKRNYRSAGGTGNHFIERFTSELPFAPSDREADDDEADCWMGTDGFLYWKRCERERIQ